MKFYLKKAVFLQNSDKSGQGKAVIYFPTAPWGVEVGLPTLVTVHSVTSNTLCSLEGRTDK